MTDPRNAPDPDVPFEISDEEIEALLGKLNVFAESLSRKEAELLHAMLTVSIESVYSVEFDPNRAFSKDFAKALTPGKAATIVSYSSHTRPPGLFLSTQFIASARSIVDRG